MIVTNNMLLVEPLGETEELSNGLSVESRNTSRRKIVRGEVANTSNEDIRVGDIVWFPLYAGDEVSIKGKDYYLINAADVKIIERKV